MNINTTAVYENGVLRPNESLPLVEGETVKMVLYRPEKQLTEEEATRRMREATTLEEAFAAANAAPEDNEYDLCKALDQNRAGERPLFPAEIKGITW